MRVTVVKTLNARVRSGPGTTYALLGTQPQGAFGTVTAPGQPGNGYWWLPVDFDTGWDGWVTKGNLQEVDEPPPQPPTTVPLTLTADGDGTVAGDGEYELGATAAIQATPTSGSHFIGWSGDVTSADLNTTVIMDAAKSALGTFAADETIPPTDPGTPGLWLKTAQPMRTVYQPYLQGIWPNGVTVSPRPVQADATVFRSYSGLKAGGGKVFSFGGAHNGHCGSDVDLFDLATLRWTLPYEAEAPGPTTEAWRAMKESGGISLGGHSPGGRPWAQHMYCKQCFDAWGRFCILTGNGLEAYTVATKHWTVLAGGNRELNEVIFGSGGGLEFDALTRRFILFATYTGNQAPRGVYTYQCDMDGTISSKTRVNFPALPSWEWAYKILTAVNDPARRRIRLMCCPSSTWTGTPPFRIIDYYPDSAQFEWDTSMVPGTPVYDTVFWSSGSNKNTQGRAFTVRRATGDTYLYARGSNAPTGFYVQDLASHWRFIATPAGPPIAPWCFDDGGPSHDVLVGISPRSAYCGVSGAACGGLADTWIYTY